MRLIISSKCNKEVLKACCFCACNGNTVYLLFDLSCDNFYLHISTGYKQLHGVYVLYSKYESSGTLWVWFDMEFSSSFLSESLSGCKCLLLTWARWARRLRKMPVTDSFFAVYNIAWMKLHRQQPWLIILILLLMQLNEI